MLNVCIKGDWQNLSVDGEMLLPSSNTLTTLTLDVALSHKRQSICIEFFSWILEFMLITNNKTSTLMQADNAIWKEIKEI